MLSFLHYESSLRRGMKGTKRKENKKTVLVTFFKTYSVKKPSSHTMIIHLIKLLFDRGLLLERVVRMEPLPANLF